LRGIISFDDSGVDSKSVFAEVMDDIWEGSVPYERYPWVVEMFSPSVPSYLTVVVVPDDCEELSEMS